MAKKLASWLKKILPKNYAQKQAEFHQMETFLQQHFKPEVEKQIQLMSCARHRVVLAAKSPTVAAYLKLNQHLLESEMRRLLNEDYRVLIKTNPKSMALNKPKRVFVAAAKVSLQASQSVQQAANAVNDEGLQASLERLANTIKKKSTK